MFLNFKAVTVTSEDRLELLLTLHLYLTNMSLPLQPMSVFSTLLSLSTMPPARHFKKSDHQRSLLHGAIQTVESRALRASQSSSDTTEQA